MHYQLLSSLQVISLQEYVNESQSVLPIQGNVLILTSPSIEKIDRVDQSIKAIKNLKNVTSVSVNHISPEAPIDELDQIISEIKKPDHIIGIGGGSVIDSTKALSLSWDGRTVSELFYKKKENPATKILTTVVPSTAGTGAELSHGAIVYDRINYKKGGIRGAIMQPDSVVIDKEIYKHAPPKLIAETGFDCLTHAIETYCSTVSNPIVKYQSVKAIETVFHCLKKAVNKDVEALEKMAITASFMGLNLAYSRTCLPHRIQYVIGPGTNTSHAQGLIMLYRGWLPLIAKTKVFGEMAKDLGLEVGEVVDRINNLKNELNIDYRLRDFGVQKDEVQSLSKQVSGTVELDPSFKGIETITKIIKDSI
ncbi:MAG: iron-containing alcohol dehydrogenase [Balneolaceae bacterium]